MQTGPTKQMWKRSFLVMLAVIVGITVSFASLCNIMIVNADKYKSLAEEQQLRDVVVPAKRGTIYDTNMNVLAASATVWQTYVAPTNFSSDEQRETVAKGLAALLEMDYEKVLAITKKNSAYETVGNKVAVDKANEIRSFVSENKYGSLIGLEESTKRY